MNSLCIVYQALPPRLPVKHSDAEYSPIHQQFLHRERPKRISQISGSKNGVMLGWEIKDGRGYGGADSPVSWGRAPMVGRVDQIDLGG